MTWAYALTRPVMTETNFVNDVMDAKGRPVVAAARSSDQWYQMLLTYPTESGQLHLMIYDILLRNLNL